MKHASAILLEAFFGFDVLRRCEPPVCLLRNTLQTSIFFKKKGVKYKHVSKGICCVPETPVKKFKKFFRALPVCMYAFWNLLAYSLSLADDRKGRI